VRRVNIVDHQVDRRMVPGADVEAARCAAALIESYASQLCGCAGLGVRVNCASEDG